MEQDKQLQQILLNSAEGASPHFTEAVMKKVNGLSATPLYYQPLVSPKWQRMFLLAFSGVVGAILVLCLIIAFTPTSIGKWIQSLKLPDLKYDKTLVFIIIFWMVFFANTLLEKKFLPRNLS